MKRIVCSLLILCVVVISGFSQEWTGTRYGVRSVNQVQEGYASWFGSEFDGRSTASGEISNSALLTAAHPILPLGTYVRVTNRYNNRQVVVRINDRGPFSASRIIDISRAAAIQLDMLYYPGNVPVLVEAIQQTPIRPQVQVYQPPQFYYQQPVYVQPPIHIQPPARQQPQVLSVPPPVTQSSQWPYLPITVMVYPPAQPSPSGILQNKTYRLQVGSYRIPRNAVNTYEALRAAGLFPEYERSGDFIRVVLKGIRDYEVQYVTNRLAITGFREVLIREE